MKKLSLMTITRSAVIAALYFCITMLTAPISFGPIQIRIGEALTLLPAVFPESAIGLAVGCALANIGSPFGLIDVFVGAAVTLVAGICSSKCKNIYVAGIFPVVMNAIFIPLVWLGAGVEEIYLLNVLYLLVSQSLVVYLVGVPLTLAVKRAIGRFNGE